MTIPTEELRARFEYAATDGDQRERIALIRDEAIHLAIDIEEYVPDSRAKSIALTKLEEAAMWAIKGISHS